MDFQFANLRKPPIRAAAAPQLPAPTPLDTVASATAPVVSLATGVGSVDAAAAPARSYQRKGEGN